MNIVETISKSLGSEVYGKLGGLIGEGSDKTRGAANTVIPTLLAGLTHMGSTREGADKLASAVDEADEHITSNIGSLPSGDAQSMVNRGREMLGSIFGGSSLSGLGGALSKFTGIGSGSMLGLMGGLLPLLLGGLKKIKNSMGLDAGGLSSLLTSQKDNIANAMPHGLTGMLSGVPGLGDIAGTAREYAGNAADAGRATMRAVADTGRAAVPAATNILRWAVPLAILLALGAWAVYKIANHTTEPTPTPRVSTPNLNDAARTAGEKINSAATALTSDVKDWSTSAIDAFGNIKDAASAEAALPTLRDLSSKLDGVTTTLSGLPADAKKPIVSMLGTTFAKIKDLATKAMNIPGAGDKLRPVIEPLLSKLQALTGA